MGLEVVCNFFIHLHTVYGFSSFDQSIKIILLFGYYGFDTLWEKSLGQRMQKNESHMYGSMYMEPDYLCLEIDKRCPEVLGSLLLFYEIINPALQLSIEQDVVMTSPLGIDLSSSYFVTFQCCLRSGVAQHPLDV